MFDVILKNGETWLVCGGRDFTNQTMFDDAMGDLIRWKGCPNRLVHGDARGADTMAAEWGNRMAIDVVVVPADWKAHGRGAGPIRNQLMLDKYRPSFVVAFPGGRGTADMKRRAESAGIDVAEIKPTDARLSALQGDDGGENAA